jgi:hypothetical protein
LRFGEAVAPYIIPTYHPELEPKNPGNFENFRDKAWRASVRDHYPLGQDMSEAYDVAKV